MDADRPLRTFTLAEASSMLPELRRRMLDMQSAKRRAEATQTELKRLSPTMRGNGHAGRAQELEQQLEAAVHALRTELTEIQLLGVELKNIDTGLLDFPSRHDGRIVDLCWMVSEPSIGFWHERDAGFAGRRALDDPPGAEWSDDTL